MRTDASWDASVQWLSNGVLRLRIHHYLKCGTTILDVGVDRASGTSIVDGDDSQPMAALQSELPAAFWRKARGCQGRQS